MRRLAADQAADRHQRIELAGEFAGQRRNLERAGNAIDLDPVIGRSMALQTLDRTAQQSRHDLIVETAGDDAEAQTTRVMGTFDIARHGRAIIEAGYWLLAI